MNLIFTHIRKHILISISMIHKRSYIVSCLTKLPLIIMAWPDLENDKRPGRSNPASNIKIVACSSLSYPVGKHQAHSNLSQQTSGNSHGNSGCIEIHRGSHKTGPGLNLLYDFITDLLSCATMGLELCSWHLWITGRKAVLLVTTQCSKWMVDPMNQEKLQYISTWYLN